MSLSLPLEFTAGDTLTAEYSNPDYSRADGWTATLAFNGPALIEVEADDDPDDPAGHLFTAPSADTADWIVGHYRWFLILTSDDSPATRATLCSGAIEVKADPLTQDEAREQRTFAELHLERVEALLESKGSQLSYSLFNRSYTYESHTALLEARRRLRQEIEAEREADRRAQGGRSRNVAFLNFGRGPRSSGYGGF